MFKTGNYKIGFDIWGLTLFLAIMLPNFIWFAVPAVNNECAREQISNSPCRYDCFCFSSRNGCGTMCYCQ